MYKKSRNLKRQRSFLIFTVIILFLGFIYWFIPPVWRLAGDRIVVKQWYGDNDIREVAVGPREKGWTPVGKVSKHLLDAIIVAEDARFYEHHGLDFTEIKKSIIEDISRWKFARGASTITQQVVKMAFLTKKKTLIRKSREAVGALLLEKVLEKNQILEWYINLAEFGDGIYGIAAAAEHYFNIKPDQLTIQQSINLALVLPNPKIWSTGLQQKDLTDFGNERFSQIAEYLRQSGYITTTQWMISLATGNFGKPIKGYRRIIMRHFLGDNYHFPEKIMEDDGSTDGQESSAQDLKPGIGIQDTDRSPKQLSK